MVLSCFISFFNFLFVPVNKVNNNNQLKRLLNQNKLILFLFMNRTLKSKYFRIPNLISIFETTIVNIPYFTYCVRPLILKLCSQGKEHLQSSGYNIYFCLHNYIIY